MPPSSRPLTTYSRRRTRRRELDSKHTQSSPIRALSPEQEDVAFSVMAGRMNKRARLVTRSIKGTSDIDNTPVDALADVRPSKRRKAAMSVNCQSPAKGDYMRDNHTPGRHVTALAIPSNQIIANSPIGATLPSPLPSAKQRLQRTRSRDAKENSTKVGPSLASPFSSRPGSRASSPSQASSCAHRRLGHHSRALPYFDLLQEKAVDRNILHATSRTPEPWFNPTPTIPTEERVHGKPTSQVHHSRSNSTPVLKPLLDGHAGEDWLVSATTALAFSSSAHPEVWKADADSEHASFFMDAPVQVSTPQTRKHSIPGGWVRGLMPKLDADPPLPIRSFTYDSDVDMSDSSLPSSPTASRYNKLAYPHRRRRTIVHLPSDSLFSSSLNFSAVTEAGYIPRPPASEGSRSPELVLPAFNSNLGPAISLSKSLNHPKPKAKSEVEALPGSADCLPPTGSDSIFGLSRHPGLSLNTDGDELLGLFSVLGLDEDQKWSPFKQADDSGVVFTSASSAGSNIKSRVGRKRGDTIRASDYTKLPLLSTSGSASSMSSSSSSSRWLPTRRTRSGTVTQASSSSSSTRRKHDGWPTIKMRTNPEPLRADEDEDDELLLRDGDVIQ